MADEIIALDQNARWGLAGVTNDSNQFILNARINPVSNRLICEAVVTSSNTSIGSTIPGGTTGSILFIGAGSTLAQDNANLFWNDASNFMGLGTNSPTATLHIAGTFRYVNGSQGAGKVLTSDASGNATWTSIATGNFYQTVELNSVAKPQEVILNFSTLFTATDNPGNTSTDIDINTANLAVNNTFITNLIANNTFTTNLANNTNFITTLTNNNTFITDLTSNTNFISNIQNITTVNGAIIVQDEGIPLATNAGTLNFVGAGVTATGAGTTKTITIPGGSGLGDPGSNGIVVRTALNITTARSIGAGTGITVTNGSGVAGNPTIAIANTYIGQASITTLGTITTGTWHGSTIDVAHGGTGDTTLTAYSVLCGGTTTTNPVQSVAGVGTLGQVLTSNGAGALPTFKNNPASTIYTVNADESQGTYFTFPIHPPTSSTLNGWTNNGSGTFSPFSGGVGYTTSGGSASLYTKLALLPNGNAVGAGVQFNFTKAIRLRITMQSVSGNSTNFAVFGLGNSTAVTTPDSTSSNQAVAKIMIPGTGNCHAYTASGAAHTDTTFSITGQNNWHIYEIILDPANSQVSFYDNGTLITNQVTNLPLTTDEIYFFIGGGPGASTYVAIIDPVCSIQI